MCLPTCVCVSDWGSDWCHPLPRVLPCVPEQYQAQFEAGASPFVRMTYRAIGSSYAIGEWFMVGCADAHAQGMALLCDLQHTDTTYSKDSELSMAV